MQNACLLQAPLTDEQLYLAASYPVEPEVQDHLDQCAWCAERLRIMTLELLLSTALHPPLDKLIDFQSQLLDPGEAQPIERHVTHCRLCQRELAVLQTFDAEPPELVTAPSPQPEAAFSKLRIGEWVRQLTAQIIPRSVLAAQGVALAGEENTLVLDAKNARIYLQPEAGRKGIVISGQLKLNNKAEQRLWYGALASLTPKNGERMVVAIVNEFGEFSFAPVAAGECRLQIQAMNNVKIVLESFFVNADLDQ